MDNEAKNSVVIKGSAAPAGPVRRGWVELEDCLGPKRASRPEPPELPATQSNPSTRPGTRWAAALAEMSQQTRECIALQVHRRHELPEAVADVTVEQMAAFLCVKSTVRTSFPLVASPAVRTAWVHFAAHDEEYRGFFARLGVPALLAPSPEQSEPVRGPWASHTLHALRHHGLRVDERVWLAADQLEIPPTCGV